jgi:hypothetical protein
LNLNIPYTNTYIQSIFVVRKHFTSVYLLVLGGV